jgi:hypothetical protein
MQSNTSERTQRDVQSLQDFKTNCGLLEKGLADHDPQPDLVKLRSWVEWIETGKGTALHDDYMYRFCLPKSVATLLKRAIFPGGEDGECIQAVNTFLQLVLQIAVRKIPDDIIEINHLLLTILTEGGHQFYAQNGHKAPQYILDQLEDSPMDGQLLDPDEEWRDGIELGAWLDVKDPATGSWARATVTVLSPTQTEVCLAREDGSEPIWMSTDADELAPVNTKSAESPDAVTDPAAAASGGAEAAVAVAVAVAVEPALPIPVDPAAEGDGSWRAALGVHGLLDTVVEDRWAPAAVLDTHGGRPGELTDGRMLQVNLLGTPAAAAVWMDERDARLAPLSSMWSKEPNRLRLNPTWFSCCMLEAPVDDSRDDERAPGPDSWAVRRPNAWPRSFNSQLHVDNVDAFGRAGGFQAVVHRLQAQPRAPVGHIVKLLQVAAACAAGLKQSSAGPVVSECSGAAAAALLALEGGELRALSREDVYAAHQAMQTLCERVQPRREAAMVAESLLLALLQKCLRVPYLTQRHICLRFVSDCIEMVTNAARHPGGYGVRPGVGLAANGTPNTTYAEALPIARHITAGSLAKWVFEHKLLHCVFESKELAHTQLMQVSGEG